LRHGEALTAPAARLRAVPIDELGKEAWGDDFHSSTWEEERDVHKEAAEDEKDATPYAWTCAAAERVRARLAREVEQENPAANPARKVLVAVQRLRGAFEPGGDEHAAGAAAAALCQAIGGRAGAWLQCLLAGEAIREAGNDVAMTEHAALRELVADVPRPLFDSLGVAVWGFWTRDGKRELYARAALLARLQELAPLIEDADAREGAHVVIDTIASRPEKVPHVVMSDEGTRILLFSRHNFEAAGVSL